MSPPAALVINAGVLGDVRYDALALVAIQPHRHLLKLFLVKDCHRCIPRLTLLARYWLERIVVEIVRLEHADRAVLAVTMLVARHSHRTLLALSLSIGRKLLDNGHRVLRIALGPIAVGIRPSVLDYSHAVYAFAWLLNNVAFVARASLLASDFSNGALGTVVALGALGTIVVSFLLVHAEERVLGAELTLTRARFAMAKPAWITLCQPVAVATTYCN